MGPQHCFLTLNSSEENQVACIFTLDQHLLCISIKSSNIYCAQAEWAWFCEESGITTTCFRFLTSFRISVFLVCLLKGKTHFDIFIAPMHHIRNGFNHRTQLI